MKQKTTQQKVLIFLNKSELELKKLGIGCKPIIYFPTHNTIPTLSQIAMWVIRKQKGVLETNFFPKKYK